MILSILTGIACGFVGMAFHMGIGRAQNLRLDLPWLLYLLPAAGILILLIYKWLDVTGMSMNHVLAASREGKPIPWKLVPAIFAGTILTHLCGGSAGREGAALQIGGGIGNLIGRGFTLDKDDLNVVTLSGMAAFFSALFGTPLTATVFVVMLSSVGVVYHAALFPSILASVTSYYISLEMGVAPTRFHVEIPAQSLPMMGKVVVLAVLCGLVSILFCRALRWAAIGYRKFIPNPYVRVIIGGLLIIGLTFLVGNRDYNGAGMDVIARAIEEGRTAPFAFLLKILFTALTIEAGFKGGEVVPTFFIGATFGCIAGQILHMPAGFAAAIGLMALFGGITNSPLSSIFLAMELFGFDGYLYFAVAAIVTYSCSGYSSLYPGQKILFSKFSSKRIDIHAGEHPDVRGFRMFRPDLKIEEEPEADSDQTKGAEQPDPERKC